MRGITSIFMLLTVLCAVFAPYFIGHGIVAGGTWPWITAAVLALAAAAFGFVYMKLADRDPQPETHAHH